MAPKSFFVHVLIVLTVVAVAHAQRQRLNPVIHLLEQHKPAFGLYAPSNAGGRRGGEAPPAIEPAQDALAYESADEVRRGLAAMRFTSRGGTRPDEVGHAPAVWGMSEQEYKRKADLWPLNPDGELINWTIVESREGLAHVREIAAVKGIGVLWPGAGTLRGVFSSTNAAGERVVDMVAHENAIQQVLAACKQFNVPCGYPANANDIETRMKQGFTVFVMNWGDAGFKAIDIGRKASGR